MYVCMYVCVCMCMCMTHSFTVLTLTSLKSPREFLIYYKFFILFGNYRLSLLVDSLIIMR